jgi:septal ring-binding cell division protein DamX
LWHAGAGERFELRVANAHGAVPLVLSRRLGRDDDDDDDDDAATAPPSNRAPPTALPRASKSPRRPRARFGGPLWPQHAAPLAQIHQLAAELQAGLAKAARCPRSAAPAQPLGAAASDAATEHLQAAAASEADAAAAAAVGACGEQPSGLVWLNLQGLPSAAAGAEDAAELRELVAKGGAGLALLTEASAARAAVLTRRAAWRAADSAAEAEAESAAGRGRNLAAPLAGALGAFPPLEVPRGVDCSGECADFAPMALAEVGRSRI